VESTDYKVSLEIFEGPLDLLLYLIKKDEVDIYDISLERVTTQYLDYIETFKLSISTSLLNSSQWRRI
jgi:segregation and condensation protein A